MKEIFSYVNVAGEVCYAREDGLFAIIVGPSYAEVRRSSGHPQFISFNDRLTGFYGTEGFAHQPGPIEDVTTLRGANIEARVQVLLALGLGGLVRIGSLCSGIGGLDLGLEAGLGGETVFQVEIEPYPHKVLKRRFPEAQQFRDVCEVGAHNLPAVDVLCGGPPCQSWSLAGKQKGFDDARGQLSLEYLRIVGELLPRFCVIENVSGYKKAMPDIIRGLTEHGYSVQWDVIPAAAVGAPHRRDRFFIVGMRDAGLFLDFHAVLPKRPSWPALDVEPTRPRTRGKRVKGDVARLKALGNAVVPDCAEVVGRAISGAYTYDFPADMRSWDSVDDMPPSAVPRAGYVSAVEGTVWALASATKAGGKRLLSTPAAHDPKDTGAPSEMLRKSPTLGALAFAGKLPTPTTFDRVGERRGSDPYVTETGTVRSRRSDGSSSNLGLAGMASVGSLPTPKTQDRWDRTDSEAEAARNTPSLSYQMGGPLNPEFVEWMMGFERGWTALED